MQSFDDLEMSLMLVSLCPQQQWALTNFVVSKVARTCDNGCTATLAPALAAVTATDTSIVTCTSAPALTPDLTGKSALQCYQCSAAVADAACKAAQTSSSPKTGGITVAAPAACTYCYVSTLATGGDMLRYLRHCYVTDFRLQ